MDTDASLDTYLAARARSGGALAGLLAQPPEGLVHTPREIAQQPYLWRRTARLVAAQAPALHAFLARAGLYDDSARPHLVLTGAGTSDYVGLALADLLRVHFRTACVNWPTTRITTSPDSFFTPGQRYVMLHFARSGESPESRAVLDLALRHYPCVGHHLVVTCNDRGELARLARAHPERVFLIVLEEATNDRGLAMTSSFSNMVVAGQALAHLDTPDAFVARTDGIACAAERLLDTATDRIHALADPALTRVFYLGNNDLLGAAVESALKVQELTAGQIVARGEDTLAFRHGPISAVDGHTLVCFFLSADPHAARYERDVLEQYQGSFRRMGTRAVVVAPSRPAALPGDVEAILYDPDGRLPVYYQANLAVLFGQLFGLFASWRRGLRADDPSIEKPLYSRTVRGVRIYDPGDRLCC